MPALAPRLRKLRTTLEGTRASGVARTEVAGVTLFWNDAPVPKAPLLYEPGLVIVGQGGKTGYLGGRRFEYGADTCLVLGVPLPFECEVHASRDEPLLGLRIDIDMTMLHALVGRFGARLGFDDRTGAHVHRGVEPVPIDGAFLSATERLLDSLLDPMDRLVVGPAAVEEIVYRVLRGPQGHVLHALTRHHSAYASIARALERIHRDYRTAITVDELAHESAMGVSTFHRAFKQVTGETPLQYLKKLRLLKAKALLVYEKKRVDEAAFDVGYVSASQFSREFKRYFSVPPSEATQLPYSDVA